MDLVVSALIHPAVNRVLTALIYSAVGACWLFGLAGLLHVIFVS